DQPGHNNAVVLLSAKFWRTRFQSSSAALGKMLRLDGSSYVVIGVLPEGEPWLNAADVFLPLVYDAKSDRRGFEAAVVGRLNPGTTLAAAQAELSRIARGLSQTWREDTGMGILVSPSAAWGARPAVRRGLWVLLGAVALLLLIACVNIANLLLAKATARSRELRIREALGASRSRIVRLVLVESLLLALGGTAFGLLLAGWGLTLIRAAEIARVPRLSEVHLNGWVLAVALLLAVASAVCSGLVPAVQSSSGNISAALREDDRAQTASRGQSRLRAALVIAEVALAMILLVGAGLLTRSFGKLLTVERGFSTSKRVIAAINLPATYNDARAAHVTRGLLERVRALRGVRAAGVVNSKPIVGWDPGMEFGASDSALSLSSAVPWASWRFVSTGYFPAMGISLLKGRDFSDDDFRYREVRHVIISTAIAEMLWPGQDPIGHHMFLWKGQGNKLAEVIGVVANTRDHGLDADPTRIVYIPFMGQTSSPVQLIVHSSYSPSRLASALRAILASIEPGVPVSEVETLDDLVTHSLGSQQLNTVLLSTFALLALLLTLSGIYAVLSYAVARRTQEIGIRVALGASHRGILALVFRQGMRPVFAGIAVGIAGSLGLTHLLSSLLFQINPVDLPSYFCVTLLIVVAALLACLLPARRALRVDPLIALRNE
ncbi:MAG TPA: ADOP family duplicated permease, partial [Bryobacteraceae bacterium]